MSEIGTITFHNGKSKTKAGAGYRGYHTLASLKRVLEYETGEEKTQPWLIGTLNCNATTAYEEMVLCKQMYGKVKEDGKNRMLVHFSQNLVAGETTPAVAHEIAERLVQHKMFEGFQVVYATHLDTGKLHTHFVINSVSLQDGHKWQMSVKQLQELKDYSDSILREYGLHITEKNRKKEEEAYKSQHQIRMEQEGTSWKRETFLAVKTCMEAAASREEFIKAMNMLGYEVDWSEKRKYVTFTDPDGHKIRNKKLYPQAQFTKEAMEKRFALNKQYQEIRQQQEANEAMDTAYGILRLANSLSKMGRGGRYPLQKLEKDYSSAAARRELAKEAQKGRGIDWENER